MKNAKKIANAAIVEVGKKQYMINEFTISEIPIVDKLVTEIQLKFIELTTGIEYHNELFFAMLNETFFECFENSLAFKLKLKSLIEINTGEVLSDISDDDLIDITYQLVAKNKDYFVGSLEKKARRMGFMAKLTMQKTK